MNPIITLFKISILAYRKLVSPLLPPLCRFYPSCSAYALEALDRYGLGYGLWMTVRRVCRCHPWHPGGYDPVKKVIKLQGSKVSKL